MSTELFFKEKAEGIVGMLVQDLQSRRQFSYAFADLTADEAIELRKQLENIVYFSLLEDY